MQHHSLSHYLNFVSFCFRNNLTIIDILAVEGQGGRGEMKLNNRKPGASTLQFDIAEKHLKNCDSKSFFMSFVCSLVQ